MGLLVTTRHWVVLRVLVVLGVQWGTRGLLGYWGYWADLGVHGGTGE